MNRTVRHVKFSLNHVASARRAQLRPPCLLRTRCDKTRAPAWVAVIRFLSRSLIVEELEESAQ
jgi:hypothetical protein